MFPEHLPPNDPHRALETEAVAERYARRTAMVPASRYDPLRPDVYKSAHEREEALVRLIQEARLPPLSTKTALEIGCGAGPNLLDLIRLGFDPRNVVGNELLPDRLAVARIRLPQAVQLYPGDASKLEFPDACFDVVLQSTVFTSILDDSFQDRLAAAMWRWVKPGGGVIWYDFTVNNPRNPDVRGLPLARVRQLFPAARIRSWRITLAPPLSRAVTRVHPTLYGLFNIIRPLRTHVLCWIAKDPI